MVWTRVVTQQLLNLTSDIGDKAISAGEEARAKITNMHVTNVPIGLASKDGSVVTIQGMHCEGGIINPLATFQKNLFMGHLPKLPRTVCTYLPKGSHQTDRFTDDPQWGRSAGYSV